MVSSKTKSRDAMLAVAKLTAKAAADEIQGVSRYRVRQSFSWSDPALTELNPIDTPAKATPNQIVPTRESFNLLVARYRAIPTSLDDESRIVFLQNEVSAVPIVRLYDLMDRIILNAADQAKAANVDLDTVPTPEQAAQPVHTHLRDGHERSFDYGAIRDGLLYATIRATTIKTACAKRMAQLGYVLDDTGWKKA